MGVRRTTLDHLGPPVSGCSSLSHRCFHTRTGASGTGIHMNVSIQHISVPFEQHVSYDAQAGWSGGRQRLFGSPSSTGAGVPAGGPRRDGPAERRLPRAELLADHVHLGRPAGPARPPAIVFGGGAMVGYDLSSPLHWSESYLRIGFGVLYGSAAQDAQALLVPIDLWFEKGVYLGRRVTFTSALGLTYQYTSVTVSALSPTFTQDLQFTGNLFGPAARFGLSLMLHPDWSLNVEAAGRFPVNAVAYGATDSNGTAVPAELQQRSDHFASVVGNLALAWTY